MIKTENFGKVEVSSQEELNSNKRFVLRWIKLAKTATTRKKRIKELAQLSAKGEKLPGS